MTVFYRSVLHVSCGSLSFSQDFFFAKTLVVARAGLFLKFKQAHTETFARVVQRPLRRTAVPVPVRARELGGLEAEPGLGASALFTRARLADAEDVVCAPTRPYGPFAELEALSKSGVLSVSSLDTKETSWGTLWVVTDTPGCVCVSLSLERERGF